jgi:hypothetical protein
MLFLLYYAAAMHPRPATYYNEETRLSLAQSFLSYLELDLLAWLFAAFALGRAYLILRRRVDPSPSWDGLALGALACFAAYLFLGLSSPYYLTPVDLIAVLYVGRFVILAWTHRSSRGRLAIAALLAAVVVQSVSVSAFCLFQRKNLIHAKSEIARVVQERYRSGSAHRLFFPFASPYVVSEFAAYLNYRGDPTIETARNHLIVVSRAAAQDGPCVAYSELVVCHAASKPEPGDLVIVLPDDNASLAEVAPYGSPEEVLLSYQPYPRIPQWLHPLIERVRIASPLFYPWGPDIKRPWPNTQLPDRWLDASVIAWK